MGTTKGTARKNATATGGGEKIRPPRGGGWQAEKSAAMRTQILEGTISCLVRLGYVRTSTTEIALEAGVSRGAMSHHFKDKEDLIKATVEYVTTKRIESFRHSVMAMESADGPPLDRLDRYWEHLTGPLFAAFQELLFASRTDPELASVMIPAARKFEDAWYGMIKQTMPDWADHGPLLDLAMDLTQFMMEGMAMHTRIDPNPERYASLRRYLSDRLGDIKAVKLDEGETAVHKHLRRTA